MTRTLLPAMFIAFLAAGCASPYAAINFQTKEEGIVRTIEKNTRSAKLYRDLDTILLADILLYSGEVKKGYADEMLAQNRLDKEAHAKQIKEIEAEAKKEIEFIAGFYTSERKWNDFAESDSIWSIRLIAADGSLIAPKRVEKIKSEDMGDSHFFGFITPWKKLYRIVFDAEKAGSGNGMSMKVYSVLGSSRFDW